MELTAVVDTNRARAEEIAAQIIDFPEGLPGDAALFLMWGKKT